MSADSGVGKLIRAAVIGLAFLLSGCATLKEYVPFIGDAAEVAVNVAELKGTLEEFESAYIEVRSQIALQRDAFSDSDWNQLVYVNGQLVEARGYLRALKDDADDPSLVVLNLRQLEGLIRPIQESGLTAQSVLDRNLDQLNPESRLAYQRASRLFSEANGQINAALDEPDAQARVDRLKKLAFAGSIMLKAARLVL